MTGAKLKLLAVSGIAALCLGLVGAGVAAERQMGGVLVVAEPAEPPSLDAHASTLIAIQNVIYQIQETLIAYDSSGKFHPMLAESWEPSDDYKTWTFKLRKGVKFHDGSDLTAADVKASILRWAKYSPRREELAGLASVDIHNDYEFSITFKEPNTFLEDTLAYVVSPLVIMPEEQCRAEAGKIYKPIGTGPFKFVEWKPGQEIVLERFDDYWQIDNPIPYESDFMAGRKVAYLDKVIIKFVPEVGTRLAGLETGEFHIAREIPLGQVDKLERMANVEPVVVSPGWNVMAVANVLQGPLTDRWLRKAIQVALDCEEIMLSVVEGRREFMALNPSPFFVSQKLWHTNIGSCYYNVHDMELAKHYLELSNYQGEPIIFMTTKDIDWIYRASLPFLQQLKELGLNIDFRIYDWSTLTTRRKDPSLWHLFVTGGGARFSPAAFHFLYGKYYGGYGPQENLDALARMKERPLSDYEYQKRLFEIVQATFYIDAGAFWFGEFSLLEGWHKDLKSLNKGLVRLGYWNTWWDK